MEGFSGLFHRFFEHGLEAAGLGAVSQFPDTLLKISENLKIGKFRSYAIQNEPRITWKGLIVVLKIELSEVFLINLSRVGETD